MYSIEYHDIDHPTVNDDASSGGEIPLPPESTKDVLVLLGLTLNIIGSCVK